MANTKRTSYPPLFRGSPHLKQWQACYDEWLLSIYERSGSEESIRAYRCETQRFFKSPKRAPDTYTREEVLVHLRALVRHGGELVPPSPCTYNRRLTTLVSFYEFASQYMVPFHTSTRPLQHAPAPTRGIKPIRIGKKPKGLTKEELIALFAAIPRETIKEKRDYALFSFYFWTARRRNEILRLTWGDISEAVLIEDGKPRAGYIYRFSTKGHSRDIYTAELRPEAYEALLDYLKASGRYEHMTPESPLFVSTWPNAKTPLYWSGVNAILQKYAERAGLQVGRKISVHWLRHTRAQLEFEELGESDHALREIQELLKHESILTTMLYLEKTKKRASTGAAKLSRRLGKL